LFQSLSFRSAPTMVTVFIVGGATATISMNETTSRLVLV
jgi:hypothetical protein